MENKQMTAAEARAHMAQGPQYRVRDFSGDKWKIENNTLCWKVTRHWGKYYGVNGFESYAPFTPYTKTTKREIRERAERAEARVKELEAREEALSKQVCKLWDERRDAVPSGTYTSPKSAPPVVGLLSCDCGWSGTHDALWTGEVYLCPLCAEEAMEETP